MTPRQERIEFAIMVGNAVAVEMFESMADAEYEAFVELGEYRASEYTKGASGKPFSNGPYRSYANV